MTARAVPRPRRPKPAPVYYFDLRMCRPESDSPPECETFSTRSERKAFLRALEPSAAGAWPEVIIVDGPNYRWDKYSIDAVKVAGWCPDCDAYLDPDTKRCSQECDDE